MLAKAGFLALTILVGAVSFVMAAAVLCPIAAIAGLGAAGQAATLTASGVLGAAAGVWIGFCAVRTANQTAAD